MTPVFYLDPNEKEEIKELLDDINIEEEDGEDDEKEKNNEENEEKEKYEEDEDENSTPLSAEIGTKKCNY